MAINCHFFGPAAASRLARSSHTVLRKLSESQNAERLGRVSQSHVHFGIQLPIAACTIATKQSIAAFSYSYIQYTLIDAPADT
jgi:hypothetical protein